MRWLWLGILAGCPRVEDPEVQVPTPDLSEVLGADEARAGVVDDPSVLFGGVAAEGQPGDVLIYNDRVRFVIQGARRGSYIAQQGGGVIDADIVRAEGPGRDLVDEWLPMLSVGRIAETETVEVMADGSDGGPAIVRTEGPETALALLTGALENDDFVPDAGVWMSTEYVLAPGSWLLEVRTTATAAQEDTLIWVGDLLMVGEEAGRVFNPGVGFSPEGLGESWVGVAGLRGEGALAILPGVDGFELNPASAVLTQFVSLAAAFGAPVSVERGGSVTTSRFYGVAPDLATLSDAWQETLGHETDVVDGTVEADDGPVAGASVVVSVDGTPWTAARTGADGSFSVQVPAGSITEVRATGRSTGRHLDLPEGFAAWGPYAAADARELAAASLRDGAVGPPDAVGRGVAPEDDPLRVGVPGTLVLTASDGRPFEARLDLADDPQHDVSDLIVQPRPHGHTALAWARDGEVEALLEPGTYSVVAHRGARWELHLGEVEVVAGEVTHHPITLTEAWSEPGWFSADPHMHSAPSADTAISMEERLIVAAGVGVQLPFGTDHDHVADYRPLVEPLALGDHLLPIVGAEISPVLRGHTNMYPLTVVPEEPNGGAWLWYEHRVPDTETHFANVRERHPGALLQLNHPLDDGMLDHARWSPGRIARPDFWSADFDAIEVLNAGREEGFAPWLDLVSRGYTAAAIGVSDSHAPLSGSPGLSVTWVEVGVESLGEVTPERVRDAIASHRTVASNGPMLLLDPPPGSTIEGSGTLEVSVLSPSWIVVDRIVLWKDGVEDRVVDGTEASFDLSPEADAIYVVTAHGDGSMSPLSGRAPFAAASAVSVDVDGGGVTPAVEDLVFE